MPERGPVERTRLSVVADAVAQMTGDPERIPGIVVRSAVELGLDGAAFRVLDDDSSSHRLLEAAGFEAGDEPATSLSAALTDLVLLRGERVVARRTPRDDEAELPEPAGDVAVAVAVPIWVEGWTAAMLIGTATAELPDEAVEAVGLLATQAGLALDNARRTEEGRTTATRLEQGDRLKAEFLTTISHEMRTPLTVLMGNGITLEQTWSELTEDARRELLASMNSSVRTLDGMLTELLDFARLEAGELWVSFEPFPIGRIVRSAADRARPALGARMLDVEIDGDPLASGDAVLIRRVIGALLENAATHTPEGTAVRASCARRGDEVVVEVADDGPGVSEEDLPFLGERFYRGGNVNTRPRGLGLGLALSLGILDLHETALVVGNRPDGGARFSFALPAVDDPTLDHDDERP
ncbi:MAG TPA: ATP-binding protein [Actinomycetota bacterium]|nr:ATP-binding protein [Actinomycetota bacterium]